MALVSLFFTTRAKIGQMELDCSVSESHEASARLAQNEIEDGSTIADHVILDAPKLTLEGIVSKTPLGIAALAGSAATALAGQVGGSGIEGTLAVTAAASLGGLVTAGLGDGDVPKSRSPKDVYEYLLELYNRRVPFQVLTALRLYDNMIVTHLSVPRNSGTRGQLRFNATFEQVRLVTAETVVTPYLPAGPVADAASKASDLGKQGAGGASAKTADDSSLLFQGFEALGVL